ncbi:MAG: M14 family zinc carboxypeptidase [Acidobacteriota bacterium]
MNSKQNLWISFISILIFLVSFSQAEAPIKTPAEISNYTEYTQYHDMTYFLSQLDKISENVEVSVVGKTLPREEYGSKDLLLCIITEEGISRPEDLNRDKPTFYVVGAKHGNEQSAKEASLMLVRDLAVGDLNPLLEKINFLIFPAANPYGSWLDIRRNEQNLDLNRDQVKLESPESEAINQIFVDWMPEATMDIHEKGDDYYQVSIGCVSNPNIHQSLLNFSRNVLLSEVEKKLNDKNFTFHEYLITQRMGIDSSAGVDYSEEDRGKRKHMKRYSTTDLNDGRNSPGIYETLSFIQEGASRHDLETLKQRTIYQYYGIKFMAESIANHEEEIISLVRNLREELIQKASEYSEKDLAHLRMKYARDDLEPSIRIKQFVSTENQIVGILRSDKKAGDPLTYEDIKSYPYPSDRKAEEVVVENWFPKVEPLVSVARPLAYYIPSKNKDVIQTLLKHGIKVDFFEQDCFLDVQAYEVTEVVPAEYDYLAPQKISVDKTELNTVVKKGDFYISCAQPAAHLIPCLLEPESQYGLIRYWMYDLVPEQGDVFPFYRIITEQELLLVPYAPYKR